MDDRINQIAKHLAEILKLLGLRADEYAELAETPAHVAALYLELFQGSQTGAEPEISLLDNQAGSSEMILVKDIPFYSMCVHHLLPFFGYGHIAYVPGDRLIGISGVGKVLQHFARRPQLQERLAAQVADYLQTALAPQGVMVLLQARQLCMEMRAEKNTGLVETTAARGCFQEGPYREEFFQRIDAGVGDDSFNTW